MKKTNVAIIALALLIPIFVPGATSPARAQAEKAAYPTMAPVDQYLMPDPNAEIALARSGAPASISDGAEVMVLGRAGIHDCREGHEWFSLYRGTVVGCGHRCPGVLESQNSFAHLLQSGGREDVCAHLSDEDQTGAGGKIEGADPRGNLGSAGQQGSARAGAGIDVLHDVEAAVPERPRHELASAPDGFCFGRCGEKLGSRCAGLSDYRGE